MNKSCNCPYVYNYDVNIEVLMKLWLYYLYDIIITYTIISVIYKNIPPFKRTVETRKIW